MSAQSKVAPLTPFAAALAGALGGCFSSAVVYPLDVAKTRIQALAKDRGEQESSMLKVLLQIFDREGPLGWYRGFMATMINTFSQQFAYFYFYSFVRNSWMRRVASKLPPGSKLPALSTATELLLGAVAGALAQIFTIPVSVIATRQQVGRVGPKKTLEKKEEILAVPKKEEEDDSFLGVAKEIVREEGVTGLWLGIKPGLVLTVNPAITYGMFERVKSAVLLAKAKVGGNLNTMTPWQTFMIGALSKTLATVVTYPYIMAKVRIQARSASAEDSEETLPTSQTPQPSSKHHDPGAIDILAKVWKKEGFSGWYQGMQAQITKAVLSQALLFLSKEQFEQWAVAILLLFARASSKQ